MDRDSAFSQTCYCGRTFPHSGALKVHQKSCKKSKNRLSGALARAKQAIASKTRRANTVDSDIATTEPCAYDVDGHLQGETGALGPEQQECAGVRINDSWTWNLSHVTFVGIGYSGVTSGRRSIR
jgi:hypothetical protein